MPIPGNDLLQEFENQGGAATKLGIFLRRYVLPGITGVSNSVAGATTKQRQPPDPPESINVTTSGEMMQVVINHSAPVIRGARYFTEVSANDPSFMNGPMIHDHGASRSPVTINLPTKTSGGVTHNYYVASYVQYPGGPPSAPRYFGGSAPVAVTLGGSTEMDIQPGTGSGTASSSSPTPFQGLGKAPIRN